MKKMIEKNSKASSGITLIALVITIIVLLILAGISISMLSGDNSILNKAGEARDLTGTRSTAEKVQLAYLAAMSTETTGTGYGSVDKDKLEAELNKEFKNYTLASDLSKVTIDGKDYYFDGTDPTEAGEGGGGSTLPTEAGTTPYLPSASFHKLPGTDLTSGLVITDSADDSIPGNEYVWIEVPNKQLDSTATFGPDYAGNSVSGSEDYGNIEKAMIAYVKDGLLNGSEDTNENSNAYKNSRLGWKDEWYDSDGKNASESSNTSDDKGCGLTSAEYTELYQKMLKSVYENGGFWIGRYEAGTGTPRQEGDLANGITPLSKIDQYPINWVTCSEAQEIAGSVSNNIDSEYSSSLMFGIQWDLVLKHLSNKGVETSPTNLLTGDSSTWGNYDLDYDLNQSSAHGYKGVLSLSDYSTLTWSVIEANYSHSVADWSSIAPTALSTGATTRNMQKNIYDLAGNMFEWTLEHATSDTYFPCSIRGGRFISAGSSYPASYRDNGYDGTSTSNFSYRFSSFTLLKVALSPASDKSE